jgi:hypothetical protein
MAGIPMTAADVQLRAGLISQQVWDALDKAREWYLWLNDATHGTGLTQTTLSISAADDTLIRNAAADLGGPAGLWSVSHAKLAPAGASDYFSNAKQLTGTNYCGSAIS